MSNKNKKLLDYDDLDLIENGIFTNDELEEIDNMIDEMIANHKGATEEELRAFDACTEEDHFEKMDKACNLLKK